jgi:hypothetical protein
MNGASSERSVGVLVHIFIVFLRCLRFFH